MLLGAAAARTTRIGLGSGVLGVWGRSAATIAMAAATLQDLSGGRFTLGLGASTQQLAEGLHDVPFTAPAPQMRRVVTQVRALLKGERIPLSTTNGARPLRLNLPPAPHVPILLAGLADESVRLAGELADGWMPFLYPRSRLTEGMARLKEGADRAGRGLPRLCPCVPTVVAPDLGEARRGAAWFVAFYLTSMGPFYPRTIARLGFAREVEAVQAANTTRGSPAGRRRGRSCLSCCCRRTSSWRRSTSPCTRCDSCIVLETLSREGKRRTITVPRLLRRRDLRGDPDRPLGAR